MIIFAHERNKRDQRSICTRVNLYVRGWKLTERSRDQFDDDKYYIRTLISKDRILHKMHSAVLYIIYMQSMNVDKSLLDWLDSKSLCCIFLHIPTLVHNLYVFAYLVKNYQNIFSYKQRTH